MIRSKPLRGVATGLLVAFAGVTPALADYPTRPVSFVVPFAPGGSNDIVARQLALQLAEIWGQPVVVENRPGGGASVGSAYLTTLPPDGYSFMIASVTFTMSAAVQTGLPYDSRNDFTPIAFIGEVPLVVGARPDIPAETPQEFLDYLRASPGAYSYGATGVGSIQHFAGELLNQAAGTDVQAVQYPGGGPAMTDVMGGHIEYSIGSMTQMKPQVDAGLIRAIAVTSLERSEALPDVPTLHESGLEGFEVIQWWGVLGPAGVPDDIVDAINQGVAQVQETERFRVFLAADGGRPVTMSPAEFAELLEVNFDRWAGVAEEAGIREE